MIAPAWITAALAGFDAVLWLHILLTMARGA